MRLWTSGIQTARKHTPLLVFMVYLLFIVALESIFRSEAIGGVYFQRWTSEDMMQTLPLVDLRDHPLESLANLHIQPPVLDILRALLSQLYRSVDGQSLLTSVDSDLALH